MHPLAAPLIVSLCLGLAGASARAQDVELYAEPRFAGLRLSLVQDIPDLAAYSLAGKVASVVIHRGRWEFCTQTGFRGNCVTVGPGSYAELPSGLQGSIVSLRSLGGAAPGVPQQPGWGPPGRPPSNHGNESVLLYASSNFSGEPVGVSEAIDDLGDRRFNDQARAVEVLRGRWQFCQHAAYSGECQILGPGRHVLQGRLAGGLTSLRPSNGGGSAPAYGRADLVLYESDDFRGYRLPVDDAIGNLSDLNFNDRARAVEVLRGRWQLCHRADFGGECQVFGPGRYVLSGRLAGGLSSLRPMSNGDVRPPAGRTDVVLYEHGDFRGQQLAIGDAIDDLGDRNFNDRVSSIQVLRGQWEFCTDGGYGGDCFVLGPGRYNLERRHNDKISSLRPLSRR